MTNRVINYVHTSHMIWDKRVFNFKEGTVKELKESIRKYGLIQPILVAPTDRDGVWKLVVGRHRYQAVKELYKENPGIQLQFAGATMLPECIAAVDVRNLDPEFLLNIEIHENIHRMDLSWQEKTEALAQLHKVEEARFNRRKELGEVPADSTYTISKTAEKLAGATGGSADAIANKVSQALILANQLADPDIARAESPKAAYNVLKNKLTAEARRLNVDYEGDTPHVLHVGDCKLVMHDLTITPEAVPNFRLVLADPPYGIGADTYDNMKEHRYDDSWPNAEATYMAICQLGYQLTAPGANLILFCTPERWHCVRDIAEEAGWYSWPRPIVWLKSNEGMRPWGQQGLAYTHECIYWGTKGKKGLIQSHNDVFQYYKPSPNEREHAAAKPVALYQKLMELTCLPNDWVLDPCVGSGTSYKAGYLQKLRVVGIEKDETTALTARKNLYWKGQTDTTPSVAPDDRSVLDL